MDSKSVFPEQTYRPKVVYPEQTEICFGKTSVGAEVCYVQTAFDADITTNSHSFSFILRVKFYFVVHIFLLSSVVTYHPHFKN